MKISVLLDIIHRNVLKTTLAFGVLAIGTGWFATGFTSDYIIKNEALRAGTHWVNFIKKNIGDFATVLSEGGVTAEDRNLFRIAGEAGGIIRIRLFDRKGKIIFATVEEEIGDIYNKDYFQQIVTERSNFAVLDYSVDSTGKQRIISEAYAPVIINGEVRGVVEIYLDVTERNQLLQELHHFFFFFLVALFGGVGIFIGFLVRRHDLKHAQAEEEIQRINSELARRNHEIQQDLNLASEFQSGILSKIYCPPYLKIASKYSPYGEVSGDMYDFFLNREGDLNVFLGDATGHGISAAFLTMMAYIGLDGIRGNLPPKEILTELNLLLASRKLEGKFVTAVLTRFRADGLLSTTNAGHPPLLVVPRNGGELIVFKERGFPLGWFKESNESYLEESLQLEKGDQVLIYTDGLTEWENPSHDQFRLEGLIEFLNSHRGLEVEELLESLMEELETFSHGRKCGDDMAIFAFQYIGED